MAGLDRHHRHHRLCHLRLVILVVVHRSFRRRGLRRLCRQYLHPVKVHYHTPRRRRRLQNTLQVILN